MLTLSAKINYGILAALELAEHYGGRLVQIKDIVKRRHVPRNYLEQILNGLIKSGIVVSVRGTKGGYELAEHPDKITLLRLFESLEGEIQLSKGAGSAALKETLCGVEGMMRTALDMPLSALAHREDVLTGEFTFQI